MSFVINTLDPNFSDNNWESMSAAIDALTPQTDKFHTTKDWMRRANIYLKKYNAKVTSTVGQNKGWNIIFETEEDAMIFKLSL